MVYLSYTYIIYTININQFTGKYVGCMDPCPMNSELPESSPNEQRTSFKDTLQLLTPSNEKSGVSMLGAGLAAGYVGCIF